MRDLKTLLLNDRTCNFNCAYCYARAEHAKGKKVKPRTEFPEVDKIYDAKIADAGEPVEFTTTFWGGEPFANPHLKNVVEHLRAKYNSKFNVVTNGSLIDDKLVDWLIENEFEIVLSNDLAYQANRGWQYLEDKKRSHAIARLANAGLLRSIQFVLSSKSPDIMLQLDYLIEWCSKENLPEDKLPSLGILPIKAYDEESEYLLFKKGSFATALMQISMMKFFEEVLKRPKFRPFKSAYDRWLTNAYKSLEGQPLENFTKDSGDKRITTCTVFRDGCHDLDGNKWNCPHIFEMDPEHPKVLEYKEDPTCIACTYAGECNAICASAEADAKRRSCESMKLVYTPARYIIYEHTEEKERKKYVPSCIEDFRQYLLRPAE